MDAEEVDLAADRVDIEAAPGRQGLRPAGDPAEKRAEAMDAVRLALCRDGAERKALGVAAGVDPDGAAAARARVIHAMPSRNG